MTRTFVVILTHTSMYYSSMCFEVSITTPVLQLQSIVVYRYSSKCAIVHINFGYSYTSDGVIVIM